MLSPLTLNLFVYFLIILLCLVIFYDYNCILNIINCRWFVDGIPIRVFENMTHIGGQFPVKAMQIETDLWTGAWASPTGKPPNWAQGPFRAHFQGFNIIDGCIAQKNTIATGCFGWNKNNSRIQDLNLSKSLMLGARSKCLTYDYCIGAPNPKPPECRRQ